MTLPAEQSIERVFSESLERELLNYPESGRASSVIESWRSQIPQRKCSGSPRRPVTATSCCTAYRSMARRTSFNCATHTRHGGTHRALSDSPGGRVHRQGSAPSTADCSS